jgi:hypothetical protein
VLCGSRPVSDFGRRSVDGGLILAPPIGYHSQVAAYKTSTRYSVVGWGFVNDTSVAMPLRRDPSRAVGTAPPHVKGF